MQRYIRAERNLAAKKAGRENNRPIRRTVVCAEPWTERGEASWAGVGTW